MTQQGGDGQNIRSTFENEIRGCDMTTIVNSEINASFLPCTVPSCMNVDSRLLRVPRHGKQVLLVREIHQSSFTITIKPFVVDVLKNIHEERGEGDGSLFPGFRFDKGDPSLLQVYLGPLEL